MPWYRPVEEPIRARLVVTSAVRERPSTVDMLLDHTVTFARPAADEGAGEHLPADVTLTTTVEELSAARREQRRVGDSAARIAPARRCAPRRLLDLSASGLR